MLLDFLLLAGKIETEQSLLMNGFVVKKKSLCSPASFQYIHYSKLIFWINCNNLKLLKNVEKKQFINPSF